MASLSYITSKSHALVERLLIPCQCLIDFSTLWENFFSSSFLFCFLFPQLLHTTMGDIHMKLYPEECPKTVENFTTHCRNGYYDNLIFHRVIKGFMVQTGDPLGDGTGGQSIWGREFEDEFHKRFVFFFFFFTWQAFSVTQD